MLFSFFFHRNSRNYKELLVQLRTAFEQELGDSTSAVSTNDGISGVSSGSGNIASIHELRRKNLTQQLSENISRNSVILRTRIDATVDRVNTEDYVKLDKFDFPSQTSILAAPSSLHSRPSLSSLISCQQELIPRSVSGLTAGFLPDLTTSASVSTAHIAHSPHGVVSAPPAKRRCDRGAGFDVLNNECSSLRSSLTYPSSPLSSSIASSQFPMPYSSGFSASSSSMLSPSATKLPLATINKPPPPPAPSLVQPQPIANVLYNSSLYPTSNSSLFERLYRASVRVDSPKNLNITQPVRSASCSHQSQIPHTSGSSKLADSTISSSSQRDFTSSSYSRSQSSSLSIPSLASLLSTSVKNQKMLLNRTPPVHVSLSASSSSSKLPEFRDSFTGSSLPYPSPAAPVRCSSTFSEDDGRDNEVSSTVEDNPEHMSIPVDGKMCTFPFVGKIPHFTLNFLRTLTVLLCQHCRQNPRAG